MSKKLTAGSLFPALSWNAIGGGRVDPSTDRGWRLLIVYRGKHCPSCRQYLKTLNGTRLRRQGIKAQLADNAVTLSNRTCDKQPFSEKFLDIFPDSREFPVETLSRGLPTPPRIPRDLPLRGVVKKETQKNRQRAPIPPRALRVIAASSANKGKARCRPSR